MKTLKLPRYMIVISTSVLIMVLLMMAAPHILGIFGGKSEQTTVGYTSDTVRARVVAIHEEGQTNVAGVNQDYQILQVEILEGEFEATRLMIGLGDYQIMPKDYLVDPDDIILVNAGRNLASGDVQGYFVDFVRERSLVILFLLFSAIAFLIGGTTGLRSLFGCLVGLFIIIFFVIPQILNGYNPLLISIIAAVLFLSISMYVVYGWRAMTHAAVIGMTLSLFLAGSFSIFAVRLARLTGFGNENMMFIIQQSEGMLDIRGILMAGIIIGSLGVLDDLVVGQSSSVFQLHRTDPTLPFWELFRRAMIIGRDHVAAAVNTLILAYAGESLPMLLLFSINNVDLRMALNVSFIAEEVVRALAGTTGLFLSIPVTTFIACAVVRKELNLFPKSALPE